MTQEEKTRHIAVLNQEKERHTIERANAEQTIFECDLKIEAYDEAIKVLTATDFDFNAIHINPNTQVKE